MKRLICLVSLLVMFLSQFAVGSILPITEGQIVKTKLGSGFVVPRVGGIDLMVNGTTVDHSTPGFDDGVWAGCYLADIQSSSGTQIAVAYKSFCMNALLDPPFSYTNATAVAASPEALEWMWGTHYDEVITNAVKAAAFQLAYWEIVHETSGIYDVSSGSFYMSNLVTSSSNINGATFASLVSYANQYLNSSTWTDKAELLTLNQNGYQPFIVEIPEPLTITLFALGGMLLKKKH
jgi:hypothetical protein